MTNLKQEQETRCKHCDETLISVRGGWIEASRGLDANVCSHNPDSTFHEPAEPSTPDQKQCCALLEDKTRCRIMIPHSDEVCTFHLNQLSVLLEKNSSTPPSPSAVEVAVNEKVASPRGGEPVVPPTEEERKEAARLCNSSHIQILHFAAQSRVACLIAANRYLRAEVQRLREQLEAVTEQKDKRGAWRERMKDRPRRNSVDDVSQVIYPSDDPSVTGKAGQ